MIGIKRTAENIERIASDKLSFWHYSLSSNVRQVRSALNSKTAQNKKNVHSKNIALVSVYV
jgi:hypothetical protein